MVSAERTDEGGWERRKQERNKCSRFGFQFPVASVGAVGSVSSVSSGFRRITGSLWVLAVSPSLLIVGYYIHIYNLTYYKPCRGTSTSFLLGILCDVKAQWHPVLCLITHTHSLSFSLSLVQFNSILFSIMTNLWMGDGGAVVDFNVASGFMNKRKKETKKSQKKSNPKQKFQRPQSKTPFFSP